MTPSPRLPQELCVLPRNSTIPVLLCMFTVPTAPGTMMLLPRLMCSRLDPCLLLCIHIHIYTYIYIYIHVYIHIYIHVYMNIYEYIHMCIYIYIYIYICIYVYVCICIYICIYMCIYMYISTIYTYIYTYMYVCIYTHIYMYMYIYMPCFDLQCISNCYTPSRRSQMQSARCPTTRLLPCICTVWTDDRGLRLRFSFILYSYNIKKERRLERKATGKKPWQGGAIYTSQGQCWLQLNSEIEQVRDSAWGPNTLGIHPLNFWDSKDGSPSFASKLRGVPTSNTNNWASVRWVWPSTP